MILEDFNKEGIAKEVKTFPDGTVCELTWELIEVSDKCKSDYGRCTFIKLSILLKSFSGYSLSFATKSKLSGLK